MFTMFASSLTLPTLALTLMQGFAAAAPGYPVGNLTTPLYLTGSGAPHPPPSVTSSHPTYQTIGPVTNGTTTVVPPPYQNATTITSVLTHTKTLTWTVYVPCTTTVHGSTSYYSTASVYTTCIPEYETVTVTETCGKNCYNPGPTPTASPLTSIIENSVTSKPTNISVSSPVYTLPPAYTCPPAATVTVIVTEAYKTITVTDAAKTVTVATNPVTSSIPYRDCKPGMECYTSTSSGSWNSTMTKPTYHGTGAVTILPTGAYHH